ncbi:TetR/AcrR family transcriptional regulator [Microlunatus soli]|nr:TetR/AcrR family transcriptional regulator [Microlunatus soli]
MSDGRSAERIGRPRSERARVAVLQAVDDMLVEQGYAALTMKGIAERAGVGRQTVYRWWNNKAEILMEASLHDAEDELIAPPRGSSAAELVSFLELVERFLTVSPAGLAYRSLLGEAQNDPEVARLVGERDPLGESAAVVLDRLRDSLPGVPDGRTAAAELVGPVLYRVLVQPGAPATGLIARHVEHLLGIWSGPES